MAREVRSVRPGYGSPFRILRIPNWEQSYVSLSIEAGPRRGRDNYRLSDSGAEIIGRIEGETWTYISRGFLRSARFRSAGVLQFTTTSLAQIASGPARNNARRSIRPRFCRHFLQQPPPCNRLVSKILEMLRKIYIYLNSRISGVMRYSSSPNVLKNKNAY